MFFRFTTTHCVLCIVPSLISSSLLSSNVHLVHLLDISCIDCSLLQQSIALSLISSSLLSSIVYLVPFLDISFILFFFLCLSLVSNRRWVRESRDFQERTQNTGRNYPRKEHKIHSPLDTTEQLQTSTLRELSYKIALRHLEKKCQIIKISSQPPSSALNGVLWVKCSLSRYWDTEMYISYCTYTVLILRYYHLYRDSISV